jgi:hypothetical protein
MTIIEQLNAAGWTQANDQRIERGEWTLEVTGRTPTAESRLEASLTHYAEWAPHGFEVARSEGPHEQPAEALCALMALPMGSTTVGAFCGVSVAPSGTVVERLGKAGFKPNEWYESAWWAEGEYTNLVNADGYGFIIEAHRVRFGHLCNSAEYFCADGGVPVVDGDTAAALAALMALPFGAVTVGVFCGVAP